MERRAYSTAVELRAESDGAGTLIGHAAVFESLSEDLGGFREIITKGAFRDVLKGDVVALFNHDPNEIFGRTTAGNLRLSEDDIGLRMELDLPDTSDAKDLAAKVRQGIINGMSFSFFVGEETIDRDAKPVIRRIERVSELFDVGPVTFPAYPATDVGTRVMDCDHSFAAKLKEQNNRFTAIALCDTLLLSE